MRTIILQLYCEYDGFNISILSVGGNNIPPDALTSIQIKPIRSTPRDNGFDLRAVMVKEGNRWRTIPIRFKEDGKRVWRLWR